MEKAFRIEEIRAGWPVPVFVGEYALELLLPRTTQSPYQLREKQESHCRDDDE